MRRERSNVGSCCSICKVSGKQVRVTQHYGANSCQACSLFFRRQASKPKKDACMSVFGNCMEGEDEGRKKACKACRFQACIDQGMKPHLVDCKKKWNAQGNQVDRKGRKQRLPAEGGGGGGGPYEGAGERLVDEGGVDDLYEWRVEEDGLHQQFTEVLGFFITVPGRTPRWVELTKSSLTDPIASSTLPSFSTSNNLASALESILQVDVPVNADPTFSSLVCQHVSPEEVKNAISYGLRCIRGVNQPLVHNLNQPLNFNFNLNKPTNLTDKPKPEPAFTHELSEFEINVMPETKPRRPLHANHALEDSHFMEIDQNRVSNNNLETRQENLETRQAGKAESMNIQDFVAQYDFNNDKFDRIVFDLETVNSQNTVVGSSEGVTFYIENEKSPSDSFIPLPVTPLLLPPPSPPSSIPCLPSPTPPPTSSRSPVNGVIRFQSKRSGPSLRSSTTLTSEIAFSEF